jgi:hypothetical protein
MSGASPSQTIIRPPAKPRSLASGAKVRTYIRNQHGLGTCRELVEYGDQSGLQGKKMADIKAFIDQSARMSKKNGYKVACVNGVPQVLRNRGVTSFPPTPPKPKKGPVMASGNKVRTYLRGRFKMGTCNDLYEYGKQAATQGKTWAEIRPFVDQCAKLSRANKLKVACIDGIPQRTRTKNRLVPPYRPGPPQTPVYVPKPAPVLFGPPQTPVYVPKPAPLLGPPQTPPTPVLIPPPKTPALPLQRLARQFPDQALYPGSQTPQDKSQLPPIYRGTPALNSSTQARQRPARQIPDQALYPGSQAPQDKSRLPLIYRGAPRAPNDKNRQQVPIDATTRRLPPHRRRGSISEHASSQLQTARLFPFEVPAGDNDVRFLKDEGISVTGLLTTDFGDPGRLGKLLPNAPNALQGLENLEFNTPALRVVRVHDDFTESETMSMNQYLKDEGVILHLSGQDFIAPSKFSGCTELVLIDWYHTLYPTTTDIQAEWDQVRVPLAFGEVNLADFSANRIFADLLPACEQQVGGPNHVYVGIYIMPNPGKPGTKVGVDCIFAYDRKLFTGNRLCAERGYFTWQQKIQQIKDTTDALPSVIMTSLGNSCSAIAFTTNCTWEPARDVLRVRGKWSLYFADQTLRVLMAKARALHAYALEFDDKGKEKEKVRDDGDEFVAVPAPKRRIALTPALPSTSTNNRGRTQSGRAFGDANSLPLLDEHTVLRESWAEATVDPITGQRYNN